MEQEKLGFFLRKILSFRPVMFFLTCQISEQFQKEENMTKKIVEKFARNLASILTL